MITIQGFLCEMVGFGLRPKNNFNDLLHDPDVVGPWYEGKFYRGQNDLDDMTGSQESGLHFSFVWIRFGLVIL